MPQNNQNGNSQQEVSGVSINLRFPGRTIATFLSVVVSFVGGMNVNAQNHNFNQNTVDCSVRNSPTTSPTTQQPIVK